MTGVSSTWYAMSARLRTSRSSAARTFGSDMLEQLGRGVDDRIRLRLLELRTVVDATPRDGDRMHPGGLRSEHVERRIADVGRLCGVGAHPLRREQQRLRIRLVPLGLVAADDR